jgi:type II secretory pathway predicted ATPase ExeA
MYLTYYNLQKEPFNITPDPDFLFLNESHKEALASIVYGIEKRKGFIAITGGIGLGKTTIVRAYLETKGDGHLKIIYIFNANITFKALLKTIYQELEIEDGAADVFEMVNHLHLTLISEYEAGNNIVLIIDEAQNMPVETLENLRMLSNLETSTDKLIQIVFIGQPEFDALIDRPELRQLKQRIAMRTVIQPLSSRESMEYITHRFNRAGLKGEQPFTVPALHAIVNGANGVPRTINILCDNALITGFGCEQRPVGLKVVREVLSDFSGRKKVLFNRWPYFAAAAILLAVVVGFLLSPYGNISFKGTTNGLLGGDSKQDALKMPIKPEMNILEPSLGDEAQGEGAVPFQVDPKTKEQPRPVVSDNPVGDSSAAPSPKRSGWASRRSRTHRSGTGAASVSGSDTGVKVSVKKGEDTKAAAPSQADITKDVDSRLLEMIKQDAPVSASTQGEGKVSKGD